MHICLCVRFCHATTKCKHSPFSLSFIVAFFLIALHYSVFVSFFFVWFMLLVFCTQTSSGAFKDHSLTYICTYEKINSKSHRRISCSPTNHRLCLATALRFSSHIFIECLLTPSLRSSTVAYVLQLLLLFLLYLIFISISLVYVASGLCRLRRLTLSIARQLYAPDTRCLPHPVALLIAYL